MTPFLPTAEELPRLLSGEQSLIVRAVRRLPPVLGHTRGTTDLHRLDNGAFGFFDPLGNNHACPLGAPGDVMGPYHLLRREYDTPIEKYFRIVSVDCRRVQTVTEEEAIDAGLRPCSMAGGRLEATAREMLIASLDDDDTNPWVWLVEVERCERP